VQPWVWKAHDVETPKGVALIRGTIWLAFSVAPIGAFVLLFNPHPRVAR